MDEPGVATCKYVLRNLSGTRRVFEMAFVTNPPLQPSPDGYRRHYADAHFEVQLDGIPVQVRYAAVASGQWTDLVREAPDSLPTWQVASTPCHRAATHEVRRVVVRWHRGWLIALTT